MSYDYCTYEILPLPPKQRTGQGRAKPGGMKRGPKTKPLYDDAGEFRPCNPPRNAMRMKVFAEKHNVSRIDVLRAVAGGKVPTIMDSRGIRWIRDTQRSREWAANNCESGRKAVREYRAARKRKRIERDEIMTLMYSGGFTVLEIATIIGYSVRTVKGALWNAGMKTPTRSESATVRNLRYWAKQRNSARA